MHAQRDIVLPNVCLSVCLPMPVLCLNERTIITFLTVWLGHYFECLSQVPLQNFKVNHVSGALNIRGWENFANIAFYLGNGMR